MLIRMPSNILFSAVALLTASSLSGFQSVDGFLVPTRIQSKVAPFTTNTRLFETVEEAKLDSERISSSDRDGEGTMRRVLGSQENLMLPRQYGPHLKKSSSSEPFPMMTHVCSAVLSATPAMSVLQNAVEEAMETHPLLRCHVEGDGEPTKRIDLFQMVREGEPNPCTFVSPPLSNTKYSVNDVLSVINVVNDGEESLANSWKSRFTNNLEDNAWCDVTSGPLWKVELHRLQENDKGSDSTPCALTFAFNHAISDQSSVNMLIDHILSNINAIEKDGSIKKKAKQQEIPVALEDSVMGKQSRFSDVTTEDMSLNTAGYVLGKVAEGFRSPVILPDGSTKKEDNGGFFEALTIITGKAPGGESEESYERKSTTQFKTLSEEVTKKILSKCRANGVSMSNVLSAAITFTSSDFIDGGVSNNEKSRNYKVLQSLDMRRFGAELDKCESVACMAGSHDLILGPVPDRSGEALREAPQDGKKKLVNKFWDLARESKKQTEKFISTDGPSEATRVFDFAMTIADMNNLIHQTAQSKDTQGRAYSAGIVNAGVFERQKAVEREGSKKRSPLKSKHGKYQIENLFFATTHARTGCLYQASCMTVDDKMQCTFHPASPIIKEETNAQFADAFISLLEIVGEAPSDGEGFSLPSNSLTLVAAAAGVGGVAIHANAWSNFFNVVMAMKEATPDPNDFWGALNFWIFFAVGHPILQPILWISDVLHGTPGPKIADLVPTAFLLGNLAVIGLITFSKEVRNAVNVAALAAFITYVGAGLDGQAGMGDFNLALDDSYKGKAFKGCPTYEEVRQPSMDNFDLNKYQGLWYEQKFHDWTQFKEVYDTTLDIKLTSDGKGWIDDFGVKGPAPDSAKLSWDKSPVANGAHYFLFGRVDEKDPPGVLRESGFGVEFPDYIVDVKKDPETGEYTEAIQFQCLERGGVRVFEGINFMSRKPEMTEVEMTEMHSRAEKAGMYPYGAGPEQMHSVARRPIDADPIDNTWQAMWRAIGVDKLLELLTESIEDGGR